jgi:AMP-polyphosphate phosphotransferase
MFEAAELGRQVSKEQWSKEVPKLRSALLDAQRRLRDAKVPVIVVISGADGAGKGETVNRLREWLDPRGLEVTAFGPPSDEERERPPFWRFWRTLPARGRVGVLFGSWYTDPIIRHVYGETSKADLERSLSRIAFFEQMLVQDGTLILKFWLHLAKKDQRKRLLSLQKDKQTRWRVSPLDFKHLKLYSRFEKADERAIRKTDSAAAPWVVVEAKDDRYRELTVGKTLLEAIEKRLAAKPAPARPAAPAVAAKPEVSVLSTVDLSESVTPKQYEKRLGELQSRLARLARKAWQKQVSSVIVFEGWDAAGKGGSIRRLAQAMDARLYRVVPVAAPTDEERAQHYLWRFWRHIPRAGRVTIFDRSWYGRVLVERVEGFAREDEWGRAYLEINDFEEQLAEAGIVVMKFWVHIGKQEQLRRFEDRKKTAYKQHKITEEDWRNREKWDAYEAAINDMVIRTSTREAPWTLVPGDDKRVARLHILETVCDRLKRAL